MLTNTWQIWKPAHLNTAMKVFFFSKSDCSEFVINECNTLNYLRSTDTRPDVQTFDSPTVCAHILPSCSPIAALVLTESYIILSTSRLSTYRINNATVKPITWLRPQINSSHSSWISHGWLNWFSTVKWSSNKQAFPTWKGSDSHQTWTLCRWQIIPAGNRRYS